MNKSEEDILVEVRKKEKVISSLVFHSLDEIPKFFPEAPAGTSLF